MAGEAFVMEATADIKEFERFLSDFQKKLVPAVLVSTLTTVARSVRKDVRKEIQGVVGMTPSESSKRVRISRANPNRLSAWIFINKKNVVLRDSSTKGPNPYKQAVLSSRGVRYNKHRFPKGFQMRVEGKKAYFHRPGGRIRIAWFPMVPTATSILSTNLEAKAPKLFQKVLVERMQKSLGRRGASRSDLLLSGFDFGEA